MPYNRPEGLTWGSLTIQGARTTDAETGTWTTPDAYAGDVHDPMSQKAFMWDRNNPYEYSDPSGYEIGPAFRAGWYTPDSDSKWRRLTPAEIKKIKEQGIEDPHGQGTKIRGSRDDILIDQHGDLGVGNKNGGEVEKLGSNINDEPGGGQMRSKPKEKHEKRKNKRRFFL